MTSGCVRQSRPRVRFLGQVGGTSAAAQTCATPTCYDRRDLLPSLTQRRPESPVSPRAVSIVTAAFVLLIAVVLEAQRTAAKPPAGPPARRLLPAPVTAPIVEQLKALAKTRHSQTLLGVSESQGDSQALYIASNRVLIAWRNATAVESGGRYTPPRDLLVDLVNIDCGDSDLGELFECVRIAVTTPNGQRVKAVTYKAGPRSYRNALGARWVVREVQASYRAADLEKGFSVTYASDDGSEWTFTVSAQQAANDLLLVLPSP